MEKEDLCLKCKKYKEPKQWQCVVQACGGSYKRLKVEKGTGNIYECEDYEEVINNEDKTR